MYSKRSAVLARATVSGVVTAVAAMVVVAGPGVASAIDVTMLPMASHASTGLTGGFSDAEVQYLENESAAKATMSRLTAMEKASALLATGGQLLAATRGGSSVVESADVDVFPISGRVVPLLVTRPIAEATAAQTRLTLQSGLAETVGDTRSPLRSPTPRERVGR